MSLLEVLEPEERHGLHVDPSHREGFDFPTNGPVPAGTLDLLLEAERDSDDGTPEWRAWIKRACARHHIT